MSSLNEVKDVRRRALDLLARREHSCYELRNKLIHKGFDSAQVEFVIEQLSKENLLSDERFIESYVRSRATKGFGPLRIKLELNQRGITEKAMQPYFNTLSKEYWLSVLEHAWNKKFPDEISSSAEEKAKCLRFLQYKGFAIDDIYSLISERVSHEY